MFDKLDVYLIAGTFILTISMIVFMAMLWRRAPSVESLEALASIFNTKGGIIMFLWLAWWVTMFLVIGFGSWVIIKGVDPQHAVVITIMGMLVSNAFGNVSGALFKTMTGEEPRPPAGTTSTVQQTTTATVAAPLPAKTSEVLPVTENPGGG